jgi:hypothetical protein
VQAGISGHTLTIEEIADLLPRAERRDMIRVCSYEPFDLIDLLRQTLPEWREIKSGRMPFEYREILQAVRTPPEVIEETESGRDSLRLTESVLRVA